jgi:hypothetical protein
MDAKGDKQHLNGEPDALRGEVRFGKERWGNSPTTPYLLLAYDNAPIECFHAILKNEMTNNLVSRIRRNAFGYKCLL